MSYTAKLAEMGVTLPDAPAPAANYVPYVVHGDMVYVSGQLPMGPDGLVCGKLGADMSIEDGEKAARLCAINLFCRSKVHAAVT